MHPLRDLVTGSVRWDVDLSSDVETDGAELPSFPFAYPISLGGVRKVVDKPTGSVIRALSLLNPIGESERCGVDSLELPLPASLEFGNSTSERAIALRSLAAAASGLAC